MDDRNWNTPWDQRAASHDNTNSSQVILSEIPTDLTHANILGALKLASGLENVTVSIRHDNTAIITGLSADAHRFFISQGVVMVAGHWLKVIRAPSGPSGSSNFYQSTTTSTEQQGRRNSSVPRNDDGKLSHGDPHIVQEYPPYPSSTQGDGGYDYSQSTQGDGGYDYPPSTQGDGGYDSPQSTQGDGGYDRSIRVSSGFSSATPTRTLPPPPPPPPPPLPPRPPHDWHEQYQEYQQRFHQHSWRHSESEAVADVNRICPVCDMVLFGNDVIFINSHINNCLDNDATTRIAPSLPSVSNWRNHRTSGIMNGNSMVGDAPYRHHQPGVVRMEAIETTLRPRDDENSTVYLVGIPQNYNETYIINKFSVFGEVLFCEIGRQTRIGFLIFARHEDAENALAAEYVLFPSDEGGSPHKLKITKKATATLFVRGNFENLHVASIQNHLSKVFRDQWNHNAKSEMQDVLAFDCDFEAAEKMLKLEGLSYSQQILTFYISVIYLEELPPTATSEKITNAFRSLLPTIGKMNVIIRSDEGIAVVLLSDTASKELLLALNNIQIDNKKVMIFGEAVPKVFVENIPHELLQQPENALIRAIFDMQIFQGVITKVDLRNRERMAIVWLTDTEARCRVLSQCQSFAPVLNGCAVFISTMRAMPAIWEFDDEWYQHNQFPRTLDQYDADDSVFLRNWKPEIWKKWKSKYADGLTEAKDAKTISCANQQMHGIRVTVMLSTLSAIHNGYYFPSERDHTIRINIPRPSQPSEPFTFAPLPPASTNDFAYTSVSVIKEDCLLAALNMKERGFRPVVLNMASATCPGGGYRKGDGAQEENIFRRSNYFLSLDDPANPQCPTYPMAEFGGIYTPDITIFRDSEDSGYAFRQKPFTVDFIAVAAYRKPKLQNNCLSSEDAAKTRRKIETIFAIALHKGHDCLLLSALGCGAFQNPPDHIAAIFLAVAQQYSRKFKEIVFAIIEDHNSVTTANPAGNYGFFSSHLHRTDLGPGTLTLSPVSATPVSTCSFGGRCDTSDATHIKDFYHPPFCPYGKGCKTTDAHHLFLFQHAHPCKQKGLCVEYNEPSHAELFFHPPHCKDGGGCISTEDAHLQQYLHVPACVKGLTCPNKEAKPHAEHFRHIKMQCRDGSFCCQYMVIAHMDQYLHPFNTPCRDTPFACTSTNDNHTTKFSHACKYGAQCRELSDSKHMKDFIHIGRPLCFQGAACMDLLNEEHLDLFSHPEIADIRSPCKHRQECKDRSQLCHIADYAHPSEGPPISSLGETCQDMNFSANAQEIIKATDAYFKKKGKNFQVPEEVVEWVKRLRPAHRVRPRIFKSILAHHHVMSADHILKLKNPKWASHEARHHPLVKKICEENKFGEIEQKHLEDLVECAVLVAHGNAASDPQLPSWVEDLALKKEACTQFLKSEEMKPLIDLGDRLVKATGDLAANPGGIGYEVDKLLGTNEHVFSILGPHTGYHYGDIILLFKPDIMHHPQSNVTPNAGTSFWSGKESKLRSFTPSVPIHSKEAVKKFHNSKLHPSCNDWAKAAAADICAQVMVTTGNTQITLDDVKKEWMNRDSHFVFEAHLPSLIPLSFVDKIIIPKNIWESSLTDDDKQQFRLAFPRSMDKAIEICDPVGADFDTTFTLSDERRKLINTARDHCLSPSSVQRPLGMSVALERGKGAILPLPLHFHDAGEGNIYFRVKGSEFFIMLTEKPTKESSKEGSDDARLTFYFGGPKSHILYITRSPPSAHRATLGKKNWVKQDPDFDRGFADGDWVNYHIQVDRKQNICKVEHWEHSQIYNRRTLVIKTDAASGKLSFNVRWLGIGVWKNQVSFESIEMHRKPLPETHTIQETQQIVNNAPTSWLSIAMNMLKATATTATNALTVTGATTNASSSTHATTKARSSTSGATTNGSSSTPDTTINARSSTSGTTTNASTPMSGSYGGNDDGVACSFQTSCFEYNDAAHCRKFSHPFVTPCRDMATCKYQFAKSPHNKEYSHLCRYGDMCREFDDPDHQRYYIHRHLPNCQDDRNCVQIGDWSHRESFNHNKMPSVLIPCKFSLQCPRVSDMAHITTYKHI